MKDTYLEAALSIANRTKTNRIIKFFPETFLGNGHRGLSIIAKENKIDVKNLAPGEFIVFANKKMTGLKIFAPGNVIAYVKSPSGHALDLRVLPLIPRFFAGNEFKYDSALKEIIQKRLLRTAA